MRRTPSARPARSFEFPGFMAVYHARAGTKATPTSWMTARCRADRASSCLICKSWFPSSTSPSRRRATPKRRWSRRWRSRASAGRAPTRRRSPRCWPAPTSRSRRRSSYRPSSGSWSAICWPSISPISSTSVSHLSSKTSWTISRRAIAPGCRRCSEFYGPFNETLKKAEASIERVKLKDEPAGVDCEKCGRPMVIKIGQASANSWPAAVSLSAAMPGHFWSRSEMICPKCHEGEVVERRSKQGRVFYGCSRYPECDFVDWNKPVDHQCPKCGNPT